MPLPQGQATLLKNSELLFLHVLLQIACSRHRLGCQRCKAEGIACSYSRSGVIRRSRKQKDNNRLPTRSCETPAGSERSGLLRPLQLASENVDSTTHERLQRLVGKDHHSLRALASLLEEYAAAWQGSSAFDKLADGAEAEFFLFEEDQVRTWVDGECFPVFCLALPTL